MSTQNDPYQHPEYLELHHAICAAPADDNRRLACIDWLERHDEPERADFIRDQLWLANSWASGIRSTTANARRSKRIRRTLDHARRFPTWFASVGATRHVASCLDTWACGRRGELWLACTSDTIACVHRGFVDVVVTTWTSWFNLMLRAAAPNSPGVPQPIRKVRLLGQPPEFNVEVARSVGISLPELPAERNLSRSHPQHVLQQYAQFWPTIEFSIVDANKDAYVR